MARWRGAFWQQYVAAIVLAVVLGAGAGSGAAAVLDGAVQRGVTELLGPADQSVLIVHVRAQDATEAKAAIEPLLSRWAEDHGLEGAAGPPAVREGVTVAGNANFFVPVPDRWLDSPLLERLPEALPSLPGYNGHTWLLEPSVTVTVGDPRAADAIALAVAQTEGVRTVVRHGSRITAIVYDGADRIPVADRLAHWLAGHRLIDWRWPEEMDSPAVAGQIVEALAWSLPAGSWQRLAQEDPASPTETALAALARLPEAWAQLQRAGELTEEGLGHVLALLDALEPAIAFMAPPAVQAERLASALRSGRTSDAVKDVVLQVAITTLWRSATEGAGHEEGSGRAGDHGGTAEGPVLALLDQWDAARAAVADALDTARTVQQLSPGDAEGVADGLARLSSMLPAWSSETGRLTVLIGRETAADTVLRIAEDALADGGPLSPAVQATVQTPGAVEASPRVMLDRVLGDVRRAVAGLLALMFAATSLLLDHTVVFAAWPHLPSTTRRARYWAPMVGAIQFAATYGLAGGGAPTAWTAGWGTILSVNIDLVLVMAAGAGAGWLARRVAPRVSPVSDAELLAGRSLGLDDGQLLQEIVIPRGRPGVLTFLNRFQRQFT